MKFPTAILGSQLLIAGLVLAASTEQESNSLVARSVFPASVSVVQVLRGDVDESKDPDYDPDDMNGICLKLKSDAEAAAAFEKYDTAFAKRKVTIAASRS